MAMEGNGQISFIDLFAGIGGFRLAFERAGGRCLFSSEWDRHAALTYSTNFGETPVGDIRSIAADSIPDHDVLVGGFPCQPFSISGVSKKRSLGRKDGFEDPTQGTLFFEVKRILAAKRPRAFVLENVKNLVHHDGGRTFKIILAALEDDLEYDVHYQILDAKPYVPQHRERIFIVGFREPRQFTFPVRPGSRPVLRSILDDRVDEKYGLTRHLWKYLRDYARKHKENGNGFGFGLASPDGTARTLSARYFKDGSEILIPRGPGRTPRRLTPRECARLMGFPADFKIPVSDTQAYRQFGNSVVVPLATAVAASVVWCLTQPTVARPRQLDLPVHV